MNGGEPPRPERGDLTLSPEVGGLLAYAPCGLGLAFSVVVVMMEGRSRFLRFHAAQSLLLHGLAGAGGVVLAVANAVLRRLAPGGAFAVALTALAAAAVLFTVALVLMVRAYAGREPQLPILGAWARRWT